MQNRLYAKPWPLRVRTARVFARSCWNTHRLRALSFSGACLRGWVSVGVGSWTYVHVSLLICTAELQYLSMFRRFLASSGQRAGAEGVYETVGWLCSSRVGCQRVSKISTSQKLNIVQNWFLWELRFNKHLLGSMFAPLWDLFSCISLVFTVCTHYLCTLVTVLLPFCFDIGERKYIHILLTGYLLTFIA